MRLYLDASPIIYWIEKVAVYYSQVDARIKRAGVTLISSHLALMECLILPLRHGHTDLREEYDQFFAGNFIEIISFTEAMFRKAAEIRAAYNFRTPDALHLAAALEGTCDAFLTNDAGLSQFSGIAIELVQ